jgi:hypothetical protein
MPAKRKAAPVDESMLEKDLKKLVKKHGATRVTIVNATTIILWNSEGQKQRLTRSRGGTWR